MGKIGALILLLFAASLLSAQGGDQSAAYGQITGTVLDENGQLVAHATVCTSMTTRRATNVICNTSTDQSGQFQIGHLNPGTYGVFATKEQGGYSIGHHLPEQKVSITPADPYAEIILRLGPKGGLLVGSVRDTNTGKPVVGSQLRYIALDGTISGTAELNDHAQFQITVPAKTDLVLVVLAPGYKGWVYADPANPSRPVLRLESGEKKLMDVELEPATADATAK